MDPAKFTAFNVLEDEALRAGMLRHGIELAAIELDLGIMGRWLMGGNRYQGIFGVANDTTIVC